ncbi:MAG: acetyl-CoA carboxylase carboxyltransferase subunit alpha [Firmicutes bacterium]|nr:acetyl-CoA carboxylase carboxyltransferase subunit alpha [Bacillota bacterium]
MILDVEKPLLELEEKILELIKVNESGKIDLSKEIKALEKKARELKKDIYSNLTPWDRVLMARHPQRLTTGDYLEAVFDDFFELHGDRYYSDDAALVGGLASIGDQTFMVMGHQKGKDTKENLKRNFGMVAPDGFRKAGRLMKLAEKFGYPVVTFIDTPGAYPGIEAEERGQFEAISKNIALMAGLDVPIITVIIGEGGSGGALAIAAGDRILMLENSIYSVISPEGCASIIWRDASKASDAANALGLTGEFLLKNGLIDEIIPEPLGGVHKDREKSYFAVKEAILRNLEMLQKFTLEELKNYRYDKYRKMGSFTEK